MIYKTLSEIDANKILYSFEKTNLSCKDLKNNVDLLVTRLNYQINSKYIAVIVSDAYSYLLSLLAAFSMKKIAVIIDPSLPNDKIFDLFYKYDVKFVLTENQHADKLPLTDQQAILIDKSMFFQENSDFNRFAHKEELVDQDSQSVGIIISDVFISQQEIVNRVSLFLSTFNIKFGRLLFNPDSLDENKLLQLFSPLYASGQLLTVFDHQDMSILFLSSLDITLLMEKYLSGSHDIYPNVALVFFEDKKLIIEQFNRIRCFFPPNSRLVQIYSKLEIGIANYYECNDNNHLSFNPIGKIAQKNSCRSVVVGHNNNVLPYCVPGFVSFLLKENDLVKSTHFLTLESYPDIYVIVDDKYRVLETNDIIKVHTNGYMQYISEAESRDNYSNVQISLLLFHAKELILKEIIQVSDINYLTYDEHIIVIVSVLTSNSLAEYEINIIESILNKIVNKKFSFTVLYYNALAIAMGTISFNSIKYDFTLSLQEQMSTLSETERKIFEIFSLLLPGKKFNLLDNFLLIGGNSLLLFMLITEIQKKFKIVFPLQVLINDPSVKGIANHIDKTVQPLITAEDIELIPRTSQLLNKNKVPLSYQQERLFFNNNYSASTRESYYISHGIIFYDAKFSYMHLCQAINSLIERHEILRTGYFVDELTGKSYQKVFQQLELEIPLLHIDKSELNKELEMFSKCDFDFAAGKLLRFKVVSIAKEYNILLINMHHIICDGWSVNLFGEELMQLYHRFLTGCFESLPELNIQYSDYALWQKNHDFSVEKTFWKNYLADFQNVIQLPHKKVLTDDKWNRKNLKVIYPKAIVNSLYQLSKTTSMTLFISLIASFALVIKYFIKSNKFCIGTTTAGRNRAELDKLIGFFVNVIPIFFNIDKSLTVHDYLVNIRNDIVDALQHSELPYELITQQLSVNRTDKLSSIVPVVLRHQNFRKLTQSEFNNKWNVEEFDFGQYPANCEIDLQFVGDFDNLELHVEFVDDLFSESFIFQLINYHQQFISQMANNMNQDVFSLLKLIPTEKKLLEQLNSTEKNFNNHDFFSLFYNSLAVKEAKLIISELDDDGRIYRRLSFKKLDQLSNQLSHFLISKGITKGQGVAICSSRSCEFIIFILSILKTGAHYIPIDLDYPQDYKQKLLLDSQPSFILGNKYNHNVDIELHLTSDLEWSSDLVRRQSTFLNKNTLKIVDNDVAYIMYTSGSTGQPKGVEVNYKQIINWFNTCNDYFTITEEDVILHKTSPCFAVAVKEIILSILMGIELVIAPVNLVQDNKKLIGAMSYCRVSLLFLVPAHLDSLVDYAITNQVILPKLKLVITAGGPLYPMTVEKLYSLLPDVSLYNNLGCTELNDICYHKVTHDNTNKEIIPVGRPIYNTKIFVLDDDLKLSPLGIAGELYVASRSITKGYFRNQQTTSDSYLTNFQIEDVVYPIVYKTGDIVRLNYQGELEYIERKSFVVKIRGQKVDIRQVEAITKENIAIKDAVVMGKEYNNEIYLVLYFILIENGNITEQELRLFLRDSLPNYMVPNFYVNLTHFPTLPNGKIDRLRLPSPNIQMLPVNFSNNNTQLEDTIIEICVELLSDHFNRRIFVQKQNNFFELGGHSLLASQFVSRINNMLNRNISVKDIFEYPIIGDLCRWIEKTNIVEHNVDNSSIIPISGLQSKFPLSATQKMLFLMHHDSTSSDNFNGIIALKLIGGMLNIDLLEKTFNIFIERQEVFRTIFVMSDEGKPQQHILDSHKIKLTLEFIDQLSHEELYNIIYEFNSQSFDMALAPPFRIRIIYIKPENSFVLLISLHHIIFDGWSMFGILPNELKKIYESLDNNQPIKLRPLPLQYKDYAQWQNNLEYPQETVDFWRTFLSDVNKENHFPYDFTKRNKLRSPAEHIFYSYDKNTVQLMKNFCNKRQITLYMLLVTVFYVVYRQYSKKNDFCFGITTSGREEDVNLEKIFGLFFKVLPFRINVNEDISLNELMLQIKNNFLTCLKYNHLPLETILNICELDRKNTCDNVIPILFRHQNFKRFNLTQLSDIKVELIPVLSQTTTNEMDWQFSSSNDEEMLLDLEYAADLFSHASMELLINRYNELLLRLINQN